MRKLVLADGMVLVEFTWSNEDGDCYECSYPAAFWSPTIHGRFDQNLISNDGAGLIEETVPEKDEKLCAVCAANSAVDGEVILRISPLD